MKGNDYPEHFLNDCSKPVTVNYDQSEEVTPMKGFALVPYVRGVSKPIKKILNNCDIKVALKLFLTLGHIFSKPKDPVTTKQRANAVYSIPCGNCEKTYLGQTKRQFGTRLSKHQRAVLNSQSEKSVSAEQVCQTSHTNAWDNSTIVATNNRYAQRRCLEAWHINMNQHAMNRADGSYLPQEYLHLVGRWRHLFIVRVYKEPSCNFKITPDEDTRPECQNVGSWIVTCP